MHGDLMQLLSKIRNYFDLNQHLPPIDWSLVKERGPSFAHRGPVYSRERAKRAATKEFWEAETKRLEAETKRLKENLRKASEELSLRDRRIVALESRINQLKRTEASREQEVSSQGEQSPRLKIRTDRFSEGMKARQPVAPPSPWEMREPQIPPRPVMVWWEQLLLYACIVFGVLFSAAVLQYVATGNIARIQFTASSVLVATIVGLVVAPFAFEKVRLSPDAPIISRMGLFAQHGVFFQVLFGALQKAISP
jgi:hypothetical protein